MITRIAFCVMLATATYAADAPGDNRPAPPAGITIRWSAGGNGAPQAVEVLGLEGPTLDAVSQLQGEPGCFRVSVLSPGQKASPDAPAIVGKYRVAGKVLRFEPRFPFEPGMRYQAHFRPGLLRNDSSLGGAAVTSEYTWPAREPGEPAVVIRVDPVSDRLPENLLKFYLHFSKPMSRGKAYGHVRILDGSGQPLKMPFLEIGEELWDPSGCRLTLLLDPGRIKRGLRPREEEGPILEAGKAYTLVIDRDWPDAEGRPLRAAFRKPFRTGPEDATQPDPNTWKVAAPAAGSSDPLTLTFPEPLDRAMLDRAITVKRDGEVRVEGHLDVNAEGTRWSFRPGKIWIAGGYELMIDAELEDLAGNSIARPFEVDVQGPVTRRIETRTVTLPFTVGTTP